MLTLSTVVVATILAVADPDPSPILWYQAVSGQEPALRIGMPYTFGTHDLVARAVSGELRVHSGSMALVSGRFMVPIAAIEADNDTLTCHMREAMGLDYAKSKFPKDHVCEDGRLPATGNDSVAFPDVVFQFRGLRFVDDVSKVLSGQPARFEVSGRWTIHGVSRDQTVTLLATPAGGPQHPLSALKVTGRAKVHLADHGIKVKPALVIHAGDDATVDFNLLLAEKQ